MTPASLRVDLKCGKGAISEGEKCTKGPATKRAPRAGKTERFLKKAGTIGAIGSLGYTAASLARGKSGQALGGLLLEHGIKEAALAGFSTLYLTTDHDGYYEKYGWARIEDGYDRDGEPCRIYRIGTS